MKDKLKTMKQRRRLERGRDAHERLLDEAEARRDARGREVYTAMTGTIPTMMVCRQRPIIECVLALRCGTPEGGVPARESLPSRSVTNIQYQK